MSEQERIRVFVVTSNHEDGEYISDKPKEVAQLLESQLTSAAGDRLYSHWSIEVSFMKRAEFDALPEFDGF